MATVHAPELLIVMSGTATPEEVEHVVARLEEVGAQAHVTPGRQATVIGAIGERELIASLPLEGYAGVEQVLPILKPYKLVSREISPDPTVIDVRGRRIGDGYFGFVAGPCTVENREQTLVTARAVAAAGCTMLRGGAFKPRTSPYTFQGLGQEGLEHPRRGARGDGPAARDGAMDPREVEPVVETADVIQIGARNMQNFSLLAEVGKVRKPVLLKRGASASIEELLMAAEYVVREGNARGDPLRARDQDVRDVDALHARHRRDPGAEAGDAPAGDRRSVARGRPARPRAAARACGGRGRRGRDHRRGAPGARARAVRRRAADPGRRTSRTSPTRSARSRR